MAKRRTGKKDKRDTVSSFFKGAIDAKASKDADRREKADAQKQERDRIRKDAARREKELRKTFRDYFEDVEPLVRALEQLPPDRDGNAFHIRVDLNPDDWNLDTKDRGRGIYIWAIYSKEADRRDEDGDAPISYPVAMYRKGEVEELAERISLRINDNPMLNIRSTPVGNDEMEISAELLRESYTRCYGNPRQGAFTSTKSGLWRQNKDTLDEYELSGIQDIPEMLGKWVMEAAPHRLKELEAALNAQDVVTGLGADNVVTELAKNKRTTVDKIRESAGHKKRLGR